MTQAVAGRLVGIAALAFVLTGCNSANDSTYAQYFQVIKQSASAEFGDSAITRQQAAAVPYASMGWRLNGGRENLIVLATDTNGDRLWTSAAHIVLMTRDGRVVRTVGLPHDIAATTPARGRDLPAPAAALKAPFTSVRSVDMPGADRYGIAITCVSTVAGRETIVILGQRLATARIDETCQSSALHWSFRDSYWLDPQTGFVWRSQQHLSPEGETIQTEILRPPG